MSKNEVVGRRRNFFALRIETSVTSADFSPRKGLIFSEPFFFYFSGHQQHLATYTEYERDSWTAALRSASHRNIRSHLESLRERVKAKIRGNPALSAITGSELGPEVAEMVASGGSATAAGGGPATSAKKLPAVIGEAEIVCKSFCVFQKIRVPTQP